MEASKEDHSSRVVTLPEDPGDKGINNTWLRRKAALLVAKISRIFIKHQGRVVSLGPKLMLKASSCPGFTEAVTMQFIAQHTSVPVPKVYCAFEHKGRRYFVMQKIPGTVVAKGWQARSRESKAKIAAQLKDMIEDMRLLVPSRDVGVANVCGGVLHDGRLPSPTKNELLGPFKSIKDFHNHMHNYLQGPMDQLEGINDLFEFHDRDFGPPVFTHGDLSSFNIMVDNDDRVIGIIDWETSGWWPDYWEYTTAKNTILWNEFWKEEVDTFLEPRPYELKMEGIRERYFGVFSWC